MIKAQLNQIARWGCIKELKKNWGFLASHKYDEIGIEKR